MAELNETWEEKLRKTEKIRLERLPHRLSAFVISLTRLLF